MVRCRPRLDSVPRRTIVAAILMTPCVAAGCAKPLFPENAPRTQFEKFDSMRSGAAPAEEPDIFGRPQPALRARLTPKTNE